VIRAKSIREQLNETVRDDADELAQVRVMCAEAVCVLVARQPCMCVLIIHV
jgi:hypothetical protein